MSHTPTPVSKYTKQIPRCCGEKLSRFKSNLVTMIDGKIKRALAPQPLKSAEEYAERHGFIKALEEFREVLSRCDVEFRDTGEVFYTDSLPGCLLTP